MTPAPTPVLRGPAGAAEPLRPVPALIEAQARRTPRRDALAWAAGTLSYAELNRRANRLAHYLIGLGAGAERLVAVALPLSPELAIALLAVLKTGAAYLPVDLNYPAHRVAFMLADARPAFLLTTSEVATWLGGEGISPACVRLDEPATADAVSHCPSGDPADSDRAVPLRLGHPMYVLYTSGSTGQPKGVVVEHGAVADYLAWSASAYPSAAGVTVLPTSPAFDLTVTGFYTTLIAGGCVYLLPFASHTDLDSDRLRQTPCTFMKITPSHLPGFELLPGHFMPSGELVLGGELLLAEMIAGWRERNRDAAVINVYGPTETTVNCTEYRISPGAVLGPGPVPIGRPQANTALYLLDGALRPVPDGQSGELYVTGAGLARGYLRQPGGTAIRFVACPFESPGTRMYRTGDLAYRREDGEVCFAGRVDTQVKLRGYRVELAEIESVLGQHPAVAQVACAVRDDSRGKRLIAYVRIREDVRISAAAIRRHARASLPDHMVPAAVVLTGELPLTANGKLDRAALAGCYPEPGYPALVTAP